MAILMFLAIPAGEKQSQFVRSACRGLRSAKSYLKKQTQFAPAMIGATSYLKGDYENIPADGVEENKANSNPISGRGDWFGRIKKGREV